ncbi:biopolymer transporter ExbD [Salinisphaera sp. USBA-960]|uniref:ExbD/TolR family protein n=1 Tax=Salinisphaera orenii TaxID=856731 RepID=UPI000DBE4E66|nr:biopolymer transporter ExbD [Salifodinibacter halophilus]NNC26646.1 biopolymer transporter ExbD [Salifodinibacter halophilus]
MRFARPKRQTDSEISLLPLTNIVFLLMIFFLLIGRITQPDALDVQPPQSTSQASVSDQALRVEIAPNGRIAVDGQKISLDQLVPTVRGQQLQSPNRPVRLRADGGENATRVVHVMQILHNAGVDKLRLVTRNS